LPEPSELDIAILREYLTACRSQVNAISLALDNAASNLTRRSFPEACVAITVADAKAEWLAHTLDKLRSVWPDQQV
jgi:hypothetical protein